MGVQPFGGEGLSGTGPKAGGPLYLHRLTHDPGEAPRGVVNLPGPTGERNTLRLVPRGMLVGLGGAGDGAEAWRAQAAAARTTGNEIMFAPSASALSVACTVAKAEGSRAWPIDVLDAGSDWAALRDIAGVLAADSQAAADANRRLAMREGARLPVIEPVGDPPRYPTARLVIERTLTINTTAAGGNASLVAAMD